MEIIKNIQRLEKMLGFPIDDYDRVNAYFKRFRLQGHEDDLKKIQVWSYCWIRRYFLRKLLIKSIKSDADAEELMEIAFTRFFGHHIEVRDCDRFTAWVSLICKNALFDYFKSPGYRASLKTDNKDNPDDNDFGYDFIEDIIEELDWNKTKEAFLRETTRLLMPVFHDVLERKLIMGESYDEIAAAMSITVVSARNYYYRGMVEIRKSNEIKKLLNRRLAEL